MQLLYQAMWELVQGSKWNNNGWGLVFVCKIHSNIYSESWFFLFSQVPCLPLMDDILPVLYSVCS